MPTFAVADLEKFATALLCAGKVPADQAAVIGPSLVGGNLRGYDSHGLMRLPFYLEMLKAGEAVADAELEVLQQSGTHLVADAHWGFGRIQMGRLTERLIAMAQANGTAVGTLIHSSHIGRLGEYCELSADAGLLSLLMVNTHGAARRVAPPGGIAPRLGTNPLAIGVPSDDGPLVLDFSTSATAEGKVRVKKIAGEPCPEGWLLDSQGRPTTDPDTLYADPPGTILPMGGTQAYKGFGLALMIDIFAGAVSGGLCARETPLTPKGNCVFMMVVDPQHFGGREHFQAEVRQLVQFVRGCPRAEGVEEILLPGDPERRLLAQRMQEGVTLDSENWQPLLKLAERLGIAPPTPVGG